MKQLFLLRHAKSGWDDPALGDHDRPLAPRGQKASHHIGLYMKSHGLLPDMILCSTAKRASDTLANVMSELKDVLPYPPAIIHDREFYLCGWQHWLKRLKETPDHVNKLMIVGHNPDMHNLGLTLCRTGPAEQLSHLSSHYPTGALAQIELDSDHWADLSADACRLLEYIVPRQLDTTAG